MTMEELVIGIRVSAENAQEDLDAVRAGISQIGQSGMRSMELLRSEAVNAFRAIEIAQKDAYRFAVKWVEQRRAIGSLTARQEIAELERVKNEYAWNADQVIDIDRRIYEARAALRQQEENKITSLYGAVTDALTARYEEQKRVEQARISESIAAWRAWSDDTCAAIRKQMEAIDEQAQQEERAEIQRTHLRDVGALEDALRYEKDAYNRKQLIKQLEREKEAWSKVQANWAKEDERAALENQIEEAAKRAQEEIKKLEAESERLDGVYQTLMDSQSLTAQAQKLLMESSQEELLKLLYSYAPDYEATGKTLGEKMYAGFLQAFGDVSAFFEGFDAQFEAMMDKAEQRAYGVSQSLTRQGMTQAASGPMINQTVNFNQPVDSPADVARRMQQVSEELARRI